MLRPQTCVSLRLWPWRVRAGNPLIGMFLPRPGAAVMHPAPINRGVEIASAVADGPQSLLREQVHCGVLTRMAVLDICLGGRR